MALVNTHLQKLRAPTNCYGQGLKSRYSTEFSQTTAHLDLTLTFQSILTTPAYTGDCTTLFHLVLSFSHHMLGALKPWHACTEPVSSSY